TLAATKPVGKLPRTTTLPLSKRACASLVIPGTASWSRYLTSCSPLRLIAKCSRPDHRLYYISAASLPSPRSTSYDFPIDAWPWITISKALVACVPKDQKPPLGGGFMAGVGGGKIVAVLLR